MADYRYWNVTKEMAAAGIGCALADSLFNPLEVVKVRLQLRQSSLVPSMFGVKEMLHEIASVFKAEGSSGLWLPGLKPTIVRGILYSGFRIGLYPTVKSFCIRIINNGDEDSFRVKLLSGGITGMVGSAMFSPLDLIRIRMQNDSNAYQQRITHAFLHIFRYNGLGGLWTGASASIARATLLSGSQLSVYDQSKIMLKQWDVLEESPLLHVVSSFISGIVAQSAIMPIDVAKSYLMATQSQGITWRHCISSIYSRHGMRGFFLGYIPALSRQGPCILIQMPLIEQLRRLLGLDYI